MGEPTFLIIETSYKRGFVALAMQGRVVGERVLEEARRHCRELAPAVKDMLAENRLTPRDVEAVIVSRGPGSYTGLRVGIMSAKTFAFATGCALLAIDTFAAIARQAPAEATQVDVIADAQQNRLYRQHFERHEESWIAKTELAILRFDDWLAELTPLTWLSGPGLEIFDPRIPQTLPRVSEAYRLASAGSLLHLGFGKWRRGERDDPFAVEPLYLRPSAAEEKWHSRTENALDVPDSAH